MVGREALDYQREYTDKSIAAAEELWASLEGAIRHGADPAPTKQLRAQLARWLKKCRAECKCAAGVV